MKLLSQMNRNLVGSTYGRFCIKLPESRMKGERHKREIPIVKMKIICLLFGVDVNNAWPLTFKASSVYSIELRPLISGYYFALCSSLDGI
jgi:hypothetical protein